MNQAFDIAIVGAGIVGAQVAYQAHQRHPDWRVLLIDRSLVGGGVSHYSGGLDHPFGWSPEQKILASESLELYTRLKRDIPEAPFFDLPLYGITRAENSALMLSRFTKPGAHRADADELRRLTDTYTDLEIGDDRIAITGCRGGYGDPGGVCNAIVRRLRQNERIRVVEGTKVESIRSEDEDHLLSAADGREFRSRRLVIATGPWMLDGPGMEAMRAHDVRIKKIVAMHIEMTPTLESPILFFLDDDSYLLPVVHRGHWIFSFPSTHWDCIPTIDALTIAPDDRERARGILAKYSSKLVDMCTNGRVFCDAYTQSRLPVIAPLPGMQRASVAGACSGFGFRLAPAIARRALDLACAADA
ncbi:FAD-binding oxidoreductase [Lysobacter hankyongensis]|uniref:FAD dependent oxidoreductase domain-containing protein n=1 Tax=Lysobacter hankyongensis TaxID=1176535 RepID=A0ABP9ALE3_9GAMM